VRRAWEILAHLESERHMAGAGPAPARDAGQLPLFDADHPVLQELLALEPDALTPLQALTRLAALKQKVERR
jgi:hypothetical protein